MYSKNPSKHVLLLTTIAFGLSTVCFVGCDTALTTGANSPVTVTYKIDKDGEDSGGGTDESGGAKAATGFGSLTGRVVFQGTAPQLALLIKKGAAGVPNPDVCAAVDLANEKLVVSGDGGVGNVFVYLQKVPKGIPKPEAPEEPKVFDQKYCRFEPHALVIQSKQDLFIKNSDPIAHNTHTLPNRNRTFNQTIPADGLTTTYAKSESEPIRVICDIHSWMFAYHLPLDHPFAAVTDANGNFEIKDLPAGKHEFRVWHEGVGGKGGFIERKLSVTIKANEVEKIEIPYAADQFQARRDQPAPKKVLFSTLLNQ